MQSSTASDMAAGTPVKIALQPFDFYKRSVKDLPSLVAGTRLGPHQECSSNINIRGLEALVVFEK